MTLIKVKIFSCGAACNKQLDFGWSAFASDNIRNTQRFGGEH